MSHNQWFLLGRGPLVATAFGLFLGLGAVAQDGAPKALPSSAAPNAATERFLLLTDGRLIRGVVIRDDATYTVTQKLGVIHLPLKRVERAFDSIQEAYQYRLERTPDDDPAERLKLARWCLNLHLDAEARAQLEKVVEISPDHGPAKAMLSKLAQSQATRNAPAEMKVDDQVRQTAAEEVVEDRAGALDSTVLRVAQRRLGITGLPVIFDLPQAMAVRRAEDYKQFVHPILQAYCARCHNEEYAGDFQLVAVRNPRKVSPDATRANLDATLRLIDPNDPAKSELLSSTLRPHGLGVKKRPIFSGSNDRAYQILATWANSLRSTPESERPASPSGRSAAESEEAFAVGRSRSGAAVMEQIEQSIRAQDPRKVANVLAEANGGPPYRYVQGHRILPEDPRQADPQEFPVPYMLGGPAARGCGQGRPARTPGFGSNSVRGGSSQSVGSGAATPQAGDSAAKTATKKKPLKIDPAVLEKLLQRNANRAPVQ